MNNDVPTGFHVIRFFFLLGFTSSVTFFFLRFNRNSKKNIYFFSCLRQCLIGNRFKRQLFFYILNRINFVSGRLHLYFSSSSWMVSLVDWLVNVVFGDILLKDFMEFGSFMSTLIDNFIYNFFCSHYGLF